MVLLKCRRSLVALIAIFCLTYLGSKANTTDVSASIAAIAMGVAGANSFEKIKTANAKGTVQVTAATGDKDGQ